MLYAKRFLPSKYAQFFSIYVLPHFMFLTDNAKLDGTPNKAKLNEKHTLVFILFQVLKILLIKKIQLPVFLFLVVFYQLLHQQISFLQHFSTSFNTI